ncbi:MAG: ribose 5-phosphate isomerase B [Candidatus Humimicrobiaceae bacterium]
MNIIIGSDHAGISHKSYLIKYLSSLGHQVTDIGTNSPQSIDYPDIGIKGAEGLLQKKAELGILICGTGIGMSLTANKFPGIRAAVCHKPEIAALTKQHNDANILCLGARFLNKEECAKIAKAFIDTPKSKEERHLRRVQKIKGIEERICKRGY